jgi:hypothetical protein
MYSYTSIRATSPESITNEEAYTALADSIDTQELVLGRSVEWTGTIGEAWQDTDGVWVAYTRAIAITGNGDDGTPCVQNDTMICQEIKAELEPPLRH